MFGGLSKYRKAIFFFGSLLGIFSIVLTKFDVSHKHLWVELSARFLFFVLFLIVYFFSFNKEQTRSFIKKINPKIFLLVIVLALITRFIFLRQYPFCSIGDEVRDGGLNAQKIFQGETKNIFGYGDYSGYGLGISFFSSLFYRIFGNSVLTYRIPAALVSVLDIGLIYLLGVYLLNYRLAFWSSLVMISSWWHLYLSRTELVVILDSAISSLLLLAFLLLKNRRFLDFAFFGTFLGFSLGFHASVRIFLALFPMMILYLILDKESDFKQKVKKILVSVLFFLIGFGSRVWYTNSNIFFQKSKSFVFGQGNLLLKEILFRYGKSLSVWFNEPLQSRFPGRQPIFSPALFILFLIGFLSLFLFYRGKKRWLIPFYFFIFLIPLTNSALTDTLNYGHRLIPLLPLGSIFAGGGIYFLLAKVKKKTLGILVTATAFLYLILNTINFFYKKPANYNNKASDFLSMHLIYFFKNNPLLTETDICLVLSPANFYSFDLMHYKEQYEYFFPNTQLTRKPNPLLKDNEIYVIRGRCNQKDLSSEFLNQKVFGQKVFVYPCRNKKSFFCPLENQTDFKIYY